MSFELYNISDIAYPLNPCMDAGIVSKLVILLIITSLLGDLVIFKVAQIKNDAWTSDALLKLLISHYTIIRFRIGGMVLGQLLLESQ